MVVTFAITTSLTAQSWVPPSPFPTWAANAGQVTSLNWNPALTAVQNGAALESAAENLQPGDSLAVGPGVWVVPNRFDLSILATASRPVRIFASNPANRPVITRPDAYQNCLNIGGNGPCRYLILQDLEFTGGSDLIRVYDAAHVWIDGCHLHDGGGVGIAAQTHDNHHLWLTRNQIARPGPGTTGEGMYLGGNYGSTRVNDSVVAGNHVHDLRGALVGQGDGIELKQGSTRNWIVANHVHGCRNPCILVYGTGAIDENLVENNLCYDGDDGVLQVQGDAIVRNNVAIGGAAAFQSHDHQGISSRLSVVHNTFVSAGRAAALARWGGRPGMVLANNVLYSTGSDSVWFGIGDAGVTAAGNIVFGPGNWTGSGYLPGLGLGDFVHVDLLTFAFDVRPRVGGPIDNRGDPAFALPIDLFGIAREHPTDPGALTNARALHGDVSTLPVTGGAQNLTIDLGTAYAGCHYTIAVSARPTANGFVAAGFHLPVQIDGLFVLSVSGGLTGLQNGAGVLDANGRATARIFVPAFGPSYRGLGITTIVLVSKNGLLAHVSNRVPLTLQ